MEREHWAVLSQMISEVGSRWPTHARDQYSNAAIVRVFAWAVIHNCPVSWACKPSNWDERTRPKRLPSQSQMSRRTRRTDFEKFLARLGQRMAGQPESMQLLKSIDGKALTIPAHSTDRDAKWGRPRNRAPASWPRATVRRIWRVRAWVAMKLLINAARIRCLKKRREAIGA